MTKLTVAFVRDVINQQLKGDISFSKMVEIFNEEHERKDEYKVTTVFARNECIFNYCPHPELCKDICQCPGGNPLI